MSAITKEVVNEEAPVMQFLEQIMQKLESNEKASNDRFNHIEQNLEKVTKDIHNVSPVTNLFATPPILAVNSSKNPDQTSARKIGIAEEVHKHYNFKQDYHYLKQKWAASKNEDYQSFWDSDESWVRAAEANFPELHNLRYLYKVNCIKRHNIVFRMRLVSVNNAHVFMQGEAMNFKMLMEKIMRKGTGEIRKSWLKFLHAVCDPKFNYRFPSETGGWLLYCRNVVLSLFYSLFTLICRRSCLRGSC